MPAPDARARVEARALLVGLAIAASGRRAFAAARRHWLRLTLGAACGALAGIVAGALVLVAAEELGLASRALEVVAIVGAYLAPVAGAAIAYRHRRPAAGADYVRQA